MFSKLIFRKKSSNPSNYPAAFKPHKVGKYSTLVKSGAGYFYDEVLEYRVWVHPESGDDDFYLAFETYEESLIFSRKTKGAEAPLVLILQTEWINEPEPNKFIHIKGNRIAEWQVEWLNSSKRTKDSITTFLKGHQQE